MSPTENNTNTDKTQASMPGVAFEPRIPVLESVRIFCTLDLYDRLL